MANDIANKNYKKELRVLDDYIRQVNLPKKLLLGRVVPDVPSHSPLMIEWAEEQYEYVLNGVTMKGHYWNPYMYHFLNFFQFSVPVLRNNIPTGAFEINYPFYSNIDEYIFDQFWEATISGKHTALMGPRGFGKSFFSTNIITRRYNFFPNSHCVVSASISDHVDTAWAKVKETLNAFNVKYPMFAHKTLKNDDEDIKSGVKKSTDMGVQEIGFGSKIEKILYGHNPNKTRSMRPDVQLVEEFGAFPSKGAGSLKNVLNQSEGSHKVGGGIMKTFMMLLGTGGSIDNDDAKDVFNNPDLYNVMPVYEWTDKGTGIFIPVHYKYSGTWEKTGTPDIEEGMRLEQIERDRLKRGDDQMKYQNHCQEFPINLTEVFLKRGTNLFNQDKIAMQSVALENEPPKIKKGILKYKQNDNGLIAGVEFKENGIGPINIVEEVSLTENGERYDDLYVMGIDSIDMGNLDSAKSTTGSELVALVKKRIVNGKYFSSSSNKYVAWYAKRSDDIRDDYENVMMLALYYKTLINLEYTKIGIYGYFKDRNFHGMFMTRPSITTGSKSEKKSNLIGTTTATQVILHQDEKVRDYVNDFYESIEILPLLNQLRDYQQEDRTKFDYVVAMGMCELADEDLLGKLAAPPPEPITKGMVVFGYYTDPVTKIKKYGKIPTGVNNNKLGLTQNSTSSSPVRLVDLSGKPKWDDEYKKKINSF